MIFRSVLALMMVNCFGAACKARNDVSLGEIARVWRQRREKIESIECAVSGTVTVVKGSSTWIVQADFPDQAIPSVPSDDYSYEYQAKYVLDLNGNRARRETSSQLLFWDPREHEFAGYEFRPLHEVDVFDGSVPQTYRSRDENEHKPLLPGNPFIDLFQKEESSLGTFFLVRDYPVLFPFGLLAHKEMRPDGLASPGYLEDGVRIHGQASIDGRLHTIVKTVSLDAGGQTYLEYWLDMSRAYAISRFSSFADGEEKSRIDTRHGQQDGFWLPTHSRITRIGEGGKLAEIYEFNIAFSNINTSLDGVVFHYQERPGMVVQDDSVKRALSITEDGARSSIFQPPRRNTTRYLLVAFFLCSVMLCGVMGVLFIVWWNRRAS